MPEALRELSGAWNFRDVADGAPMLRPGRLFRSGELSGLDDEAGFPTGSRCTCCPFPISASTRPAPTTRRRTSTPSSGCSPATGAEQSAESVDEAATRYMIDEYRQFPTRNGAQRALHRVISLLGAGRAVLTHCFAGKDRTGFVVATVLEAIGVDRDVIVADFLRSNDAAPALRAQISAMIAQRQDTELTPEVVTWTEARLSDGVLGVREEYLAAARQTIDEKFGSLQAYLRDAGVGEADVQRLRAALLA